VKVIEEMLTLVITKKMQMDIVEKELKENLLTIVNNMEKPRIIKIKWMDVISLDTSLITKEDLINENIKPCTAEIIGFLVHEDKDNYFIAKELWETGQFKYIHIIPKKTAIIEIKNLSETIGCPKCGCIEINQYIKKKELECKKCKYRWSSSKL